jgi:hypothetical protein
MLVHGRNDITVLPAMRAAGCRLERGLAHVECSHGNMNFSHYEAGAIVRASPLA